MTIINTRHVYPLKYDGSIFWLLFFLIFWPPLAFFLLLMNARFVKVDSIFYLRYRGSWGWLIFWAVVFFPLAILIMAVCGADVIEEKNF
jgi:hypothetical protein